MNKMKLSSLVANDDGSSYNKLAFFALDGKGQLTIKNTKFATQIARDIPNVGITASNLSVLNVNGDVFTIDPYTKGYDVRGNDDHQYSNGLIACNQVALVEAGFAGKTVNLATGLPFETYFLGDGGPNEELIARKEDAYRNAKILNKVDAKGYPTQLDQSKLVTIAKNTVYPEAVGAFFDITIDIDGSDKMTFDGDVLVIDMGSFTTDVAVIGPAGRIRSKYSFTMKNNGFLNIYDRFTTELKRKGYAVGDSIVHSKSEAAFKTGKLKLLTGEVDVKEITASVVATEVRPIIEAIRSKIGDHINSLEAIICVGGGASSIKDHFGELSKHVLIPENPQFSNANGFLKALVYLSGDDVEIIDDITTAETADAI